MKKIPNHIAIIMDGNGRWAEKKGLKRIDGHKAGVKAVKKIVKYCAEINVNYLTLYTFSTENWNRPKKEIISLMNLLIQTLDNELALLQNNNIKFNVFGNLEKLNVFTKRKLKKVEEITKENSNLQLNLAISYSGRSEIILAINKILKNDIKKIDENTFYKYLLTNSIPNPDLLIRTGDEIRISNFLLWQIAYSELYFTKRLWPDFNKKIMEQILINFNKRERRFGKISEQIKI